jgi:type II secretory pathway pseudopilin PulG
MSLVETVIALFLLVSAFTVVTNLLFRSTQALVRVEERAFAVSFAETVMDDIAVWAEDSDNFASDWAIWSNATMVEYPGYVAKVTATTPILFTPCRQLEIGKPAAERREIVASYRDLEIAIESKGAELFRLHTRLAEPERPITLVEVKLISGSTSLAAGGTAILEAVLLDGSNQIVEDVSFRWSVQPDDDGNGTVKSLTTNYAQAELTNVFRSSDGTLRQVAGKCRVMAVARYRGQEYRGLSEPVEMLP